MATLTLAGFRGQNRTIDLSERTWISGDNAAGKTSATEALLFALYGCVPAAGKGREALAKLLGPDGTAEVRLVLDDGNAICRSMAVKKKAPTIVTTVTAPDGTIQDGALADAWIHNITTPESLTQVSVLGAMSTPDRKRLIVDLLPPESSGMDWIKEGALDSIAAMVGEKNGDLFKKRKVSGSKKRIDELEDQTSGVLPVGLLKTFREAKDAKAALEAIREKKNAADAARKAAENLLASAANATISDEDAALVGELDSIEAELTERQAELADLNDKATKAANAIRQRATDQETLASLQADLKAANEIKESLEALTKAKAEAKEALDAHKRTEPVDMSGAEARLVASKNLAASAMALAKERGGEAFEQLNVARLGVCHCCGQRLPEARVSNSIRKIEAVIAEARENHAKAKAMLAEAEAELLRYNIDKAKASVDKQEWHRKKLELGTVFDKAQEALSVASAKVDPLRIQRMEAEIVRTQNRLKAAVEGVDENLRTSLQATVDRLVTQQRRAVQAKAVTDIAGSAKVSEKRTEADRWGAALDGAQRALRDYTTARMRPLIEPMQKAVSAMGMKGEVALDVGDDFRLGVMVAGKYVDIDVLSGSEYVRFVLAMVMALAPERKTWIVMDTDGMRPKLCKTVMEWLASVGARVVASSWVQPPSVDGWTSVDLSDQVQ